ncbi:MAG: hypothetical protein V7604_1740 [Hyphomicrobiales bacterium]|jgi:hypothetical protein
MEQVAREPLTNDRQRGKQFAGTIMNEVRG